MSRVRLMVLLGALRAGRIIGELWIWGSKARVWSHLSPRCVCPWVSHSPALSLFYLLSNVGSTPCLACVSRVSVGFCAYVLDLDNAERRQATPGISSIAESCPNSFSRQAIHFFVLVLPRRRAFLMPADLRTYLCMFHLTRLYKVLRFTFSL